jgi:hypothetical protein
MGKKTVSKTIAIENEVGLIPTIEVVEGEHALKADQENGISAATSANAL